MSVRISKYKVYTGICGTFFHIEPEVKEMCNTSGKPLQFNITVQPVDFQMYYPTRDVRLVKHGMWPYIYPGCHPSPHKIVRKCGYRGALGFFVDVEEVKKKSKIHFNLVVNASPHAWYDVVPVELSFDSLKKSAFIAKCGLEEESYYKVWHGNIMTRTVLKNYQSVPMYARVEVHYTENGVEKVEKNPVPNLGSGVHKGYTEIPPAQKDTCWANTTSRKGVLKVGTETIEVGYIKPDPGTSVKLKIYQQAFINGEYKDYIVEIYEFTPDLSQDRDWTKLVEEQPPSDEEEEEEDEEEEEEEEEDEEGWEGLLEKYKDYIILLVILAFAIGIIKKLSSR